MPRRLLGLFAILLFGLHLPDLQLPYFWDEAGYFIPAALDLFATGDPIPSSVIPIPHPPLMMAVLALVWRVAGVSLLATRVTMLGWALAASCGAYQLGRRAGGGRAAWMSAVCLALYPVFFAQSSLAQLDLPAAALTTWALVFYWDRRLVALCLALSMAVLTKESAVVCAVTLAAVELLWPSSGRRSWHCVAALLAPVLLLGLWFAYVYARTGHALGTPEFVRFNLGIATYTPSRLLAAVALRLWHGAGHMFLFALTLPAAALLVASQPVRRRLCAPESRLLHVLMLCVAAYAAAFSMAGGALLARYMLTAVTFVVVISTSVLAAVSWGPALAMVSLGAFGAGLVVSPAYHCAYDDTLLYRPFIVLHQQAAAYLETLGEPVITTWPASDELLRPALGYVSRRNAVVVLQDFSVGSLRVARSQCGSCPIFYFPTQYEPEDSWLRPGRLLRRLRFWRSAHQQFETRPSLLSPQDLAKAVDGRIVWERHIGGQFAVVIR